MKYNKSVLFLFVSLVTIGCHQSERSQQREKYVYNNGRDTISVVLYLTDNAFQGSYKKCGPGGFKMTGDISGEVQGDTLLGSLYYTPYKGRDKRRRAVALLKQNSDYILGNGNSSIYMGIPYFEIESLTFNGPILKADKSSQVD